MFRDYLQQLVEMEQIPGAVLYVSHKENFNYFEAFGSFLDSNGRKQPIYKNTIFDIASLTKITATLPALLYLSSKKEIFLDQPLQSYLPEFQHPEITITQLLQHTSGLPADLPFVDRMFTRDVFSEILNTKLLYTPGSKSIYSDLGMILLGKLIERVSSQPLDVFVKQQIFNPWTMVDTMYRLPNHKKSQAASTEWYKNKYIQGVVHDEKAYQMNGVSGSAGVFSTAKDIARFATNWLYPEQQNVIPTAFLREAITHKQNNRGLGFEVWSGDGEFLSCGKQWSKGSFGHTGFTGTSVWIDPTQELIVVLLTNAVQFGRNTTIKRIRSNVHSLIYSSLT